ncbi:29041_t:CDS:2 [Gigaspora margarita]|uniref:29041_t:CDS:1 n=1 Tax=Gigaspora margarita TaxID=4874 RepID=A0ABN7UM80_GIGMA|nr:29041_t:CDS:2 [Gigaspora margarita]
MEHETITQTHVVATYLEHIKWMCSSRDESPPSDSKPYDSEQ